MTDILSREARSQRMSLIRSRGNARTELLFVRLLKERSINGWRRHYSGLPGKPDFVFREQRIAVFIDGCFWHGCPTCYREPVNNRTFWKEKLRRNRLRDREVSRDIRRRGWKVFRIWECHLVKRHDLPSSLRRLLAPRYLRGGREGGNVKPPR